MVVENKIDYSQIIEIIKEGIYDVIQDNDLNGDGAYAKLNILISNEQFFIRQKKEGKLEANTIYMVVKFSPAAVDYGVTVLPLSVITFSEQNKCDLCQRLLQDFVTTQNMETNNDATIQQFYESPVVNSNFNEMNEGFRSVLTISGTFVISESANPFTLSWWDPINAEWKEVYFINGNITGNFQVDPKLFYESNDYTESISTMGTITFNISSILLSDDGGFLDEMLKFITNKAKYTIDLDPTSSTYMQKIKDNSINATNINEDLVFKIKFKNNQTLTDIFKLANVDIQQVLKKIPMISLVFSN